MRKAEKEAAAIEERYQSFEKRLEELEYLNHKQEAEIKSLSRLVYDNQTNKNQSDDNKKSKK